MGKKAGRKPSEPSTTTGHLEGDKLLRTFASALARNLRAIDIAARLGGDEFALVLPETGEEAAEQFLRRLRVALLREMQTAEPPWDMTFSMGAVTVVDPSISSEDLVRSADIAMYQVKRNGKDGLCVTTLEPHAPTRAGVV